MADINSTTIDGLLAYCDYLIDKGYAPPSQVEPWKTAIKKVFYTVLGKDYGPSSLGELDLDEIVGRFRVLANDQYKQESITAYQRRVQNALDAHAYFREHNRPPAFRQVSKRSNGDSPPKAKSPRKANLTAVPPVESPKAAPTGGDSGESEFFDFTYPLEFGRMATMHLPKRMSKADVGRLTTVLQTLQSDAPSSGEDDLAA